MSSRHSLASLTRVGSIQALGYLATLTWNLILARSLSLELYGRVSFAVTIVLVLQVVFGHGGTQALIRYLPATRSKRDADACLFYRRLAARRSLILGAAVLLPALLMGRIWPGLHLAHFDLGHWILILGAGMGAAMVNLLMGWQLGVRHPARGSFAGMALLACLLVPTLATALRAGRGDLAGLLQVLLFVFGGTGILAFALLWGRGAIRPEDALRGEKRYSLFARRSLVIAMVSLGLTYMDRIMLGAFGQFSDLGIYNLAARFTRLLFIAGFLLTPLLGPFYASHLPGGNRERALQVYRHASTLIAALILPLAATFTFFGGDLLVAAAGDPYRQAVPVLTLLSLGAFLVCLTGNNNLLLQMGGRERSEMWISLGAIAINFVLNLVLIPHLGAMGAALATFFGLVTAALARSWIVWRVWQVWPGGMSNSRLLPALGSFVLTRLALLFLPLPWLLEMILCLTAYGAVYGLRRLYGEILSLGSELEGEKGIQGRPV